MISSILILAVAFISLIILMIIHEFGHFIIAKKFGIRVDEFGIGYPPRLFGKKIGETIYSINWLPLGAFVRIYGEEGGVDDYRSFQNLKNSSTKERVVIALMMFLTIGATTAGAFFTGGGSLLIVALLIGALMLSVQAGGMAYACYKHKNEVKDDSRKVPELPIGRERSSLQFVDGLSV